ncbi:MAG: carboxylating nicotinate-nucleotide diphosphorylase [Actinomycetes bacterium]
MTASDSLRDLPDDLTGRLRAAGLDPQAVRAVALAAVAEDLGGGVDVTSDATVPESQRATARFVARKAGVVAGLPVVEAVLHLVAGPNVEVGAHAQDGDRVRPGDVLLVATARTRALLTAERTALNLLTHLSGVATLTRQWVDAVAGTGAEIRDTRKTLPGLRALEKYAVRCGGGTNHRMGLWDAALVKDNHVVAAGGVAEAFRAVRAADAALPVEVECDTVAQVAEAVDAGADLVLCDNMPPERLAEAVAVTAGRARLEASGALSLAVARQVAETGVDYLAVGALTHSAPALDIGLDLDARPPGEETTQPTTTGRKGRD